MKIIKLFQKLFLIIIHLIIGLLVSFLLFRLLHFDKKQKIIKWWYKRFIKIINLQVKVHGGTPKNCCLIVSNHISWLDIIVIGHLLPTIFLSKAEVKKWPLLGWLASSANTIYIKRGGGQSENIRNIMVDKFRKNLSITIFPEGKTTDGETVGQFFPRLFAAAIETKTPVLPISLNYHINNYKDKSLAFIGSQNFFENFFSIIKRDKIQVEVCLLDAVKSENFDRKRLAIKAQNIITISKRNFPYST